MKESAVVVEGKRDAMALRKVGFDGKILEFHKFGGMINFADNVAKYERLIILFDRDRKGRVLTGKTVQLLQRRTKIDLTFNGRHIHTDFEPCRLEFIPLYLRMDVVRQVPSFLIGQMGIRFHRRSVKPCRKGEVDVFWVKAVFVGIGICQVVYKNLVVPNIK